jgi:hypothetical protein
MPTCTLTYARTVILKRSIEAKNLESAERKAEKLEKNGKLGLDVTEIGDKNGETHWLWDAKPDSEIDDIEVDDGI